MFFSSHLINQQFSRLSLRFYTLGILILMTLLMTTVNIDKSNIRYSLLAERPEAGGHSIVPLGSRVQRVRQNGLDKNQSNRIQRRCN
jgi:hypothetical protein